jgi:uncharacterized protein
MVATGPADAGTCDPGKAEIRWDGGQATFSVEVADDAAERNQGLMFRDTLAQDAGMLFVYPSPRPARFWMKNTLIPLDMIFADRKGRVTRVHSNAIPQDLTTIDGGNAVMFILEINGGLAQRLGIGPGAELRHPVIPDDLAAWPCAD